jgi:hypothetical protein
MTSTSFHDQTTLDTTLAALPPLPMAALMIGVYNLLCEGADLSQPRYVSVSEACQHIDLQFRREQSSLQAITQWSRRFGGVLTQEPHDGDLGPSTFVKAAFDYYGLEVETYAFIPADQATV